MILTDSKQEIIDYIETTYECIFKGELTVTYDELRESYSLKLIIQSWTAPLYLTHNGTLEEFMSYCKDEIKKRRLDRVDYYSGYKNDRGTNN